MTPFLRCSCPPLIAGLFLLLASCTEPTETSPPLKKAPVSATDTLALDDSSPTLSLEQANRLAALPLACIPQEYPNKLSQTLAGPADLAGPRVLHPAFYGCFDWHSAVHGHWSLVALLKEFPGLDDSTAIRELLRTNLSPKNIAAELAYFQRATETSYERTYGWAWLLKLAEELQTWQDPLGPELAANLQPLTDLIVSRYLDFLPKLNYPIRTGEHPNTAFGLAFAWDYATITDHVELKNLIARRARDFYATDRSCPLGWEPGGYDFLSPCLEEIDIMRRVLPAEEFHRWLSAFLPALTQPDFTLAVGLVSDRTDGKLVHLDGLNFSRAWVLSGLARQYPRYAHLRRVANRHINYSLPNLVGDDYEGGHWLGSFALYALRK